MPRGEPLSRLHAKRKRDIHPDKPVSGTYLLVKRIDKVGTQSPYCIETHPANSPWDSAAKKKRIQQEGRTQKKKADVLVSICGYPVPMCKSCWKNYLEVYLSALDPITSGGGESKPSSPPSAHTDSTP